jgi:hypothetical protein
VSSTYRILCLSHDPAITVNDPGYNRAEDAERAIRERPTDHEHCDLVIGRYSAAFVELGCPTSRGQPEHLRPSLLRCYHGGTKWTDMDWLLLLAAAYQSTDPGVQKAITDGRHGCLPWERLRRLRAELGITLGEETPART